MKAIWKGTLLAASNDTIVVEGNHYFPEASLNQQYFRKSAHQTTCAWKGMASYYDVVVGSQVNPNAAWYYAEPADEATEIRGRVAFWHGVEVTA